MTYLEATKDYYRRAAETPEPGLCCTASPPWRFPGLTVPPRMEQMNYGCGTTVHPRDLVDSPDVLYVGVGAGMELLQFAYFSRRAGAVIGIDPVAAMRRVCRENLALAAHDNDWFREEFVEVRDGDGLALPLPDASIDVVAQNCVFNMFAEQDLHRALAESHRVLRPGGRFVLSDPVSAEEIPEALQRDPQLRAMCLSGATSYDRYLELLVQAGFGTIEVRARRPYRLLDPKRYDVPHPILLESIEVAAIKSRVLGDGPCVFTGRTVIYCGDGEIFDDGAGHILSRGVPAAVCDKTAVKLGALGDDFVVTPSTWFHDGGGCC